ncbi:alpha/beta hydrolase fold domain-containing protein [Streptomyces misionensis]|uniref:alpha/beta hydrolase fold domain-containing protein n=1 Tax=Streptomyces misionensis TaxID=67331 RepID=UPI003F4D0081
MIGGADVGFGEHCLQSRQDSVDVGQDGYSVQHGHHCGAKTAERCVLFTQTWCGGQPSGRRQCLWPRTTSSTCPGHTSISGVTPARIVVAGAGTGGGIAVGTVLLARGLGNPAITAQVLFCTISRVIARDKPGDTRDRPRDTGRPWMRSKSSSPTVSARLCASVTCS